MKDRSFSFERMNSSLKIERSSSLSKTTSAMLKQLEENQLLRIEIFHLRTFITDQEQYYFNTIRTQEIITQNMLSQLNITERSIQDQARTQLQRNFQQDFLNISKSVSSYIRDVNSMLENYQAVRKQWEAKHYIHQYQNQDHQDLLAKCSDKFDQARSIIESLTSQSDQKNIIIEQSKHQIKCLKEEMQAVEREVDFLDTQKQQFQAEIIYHTTKLLELQEENQALQDQIANFHQKYQNSQQERVSFRHQLQEQNEALSKQNQYLQKENHSLQLENQSLMKKHQLSLKIESENKQKQKNYHEKSQDDSLRIIELANECFQLKKEIQALERENEEVKDVLKQQEQCLNKEYEKQSQKIRSFQKDHQNRVLMEREQNQASKKCLKKKFDLQSLQHKVSASNLHSLLKMYSHRS